MMGPTAGLHQQASGRCLSENALTGQTKFDRKSGTHDAVWPSLFLGPWTHQTSACERSQGIHAARARQARHAGSRTLTLHGKEARYDPRHTAVS
jgi:hypothetical protein